MKTLKLAILLFSIFCGAMAYATDATETQAPLVMLKKTADQMTGELDRYKGRLKGNDQFIYGIVRRILLPHFDLPSMSRGVVGKSYWEQASPALQKQFIDEFTFYVVRTYSGALASYDGEKIKFYPIRGFNPSAQRVEASSDIVRKSGPSVGLSYRLYQSGGAWIIYDFSVEGVSLVQNYRAQFASTLQQGGMTKLVADLHSHNQSAR
jgi:phospholipid transport system substrate-binding protein